MIAQTILLLVALLQNIQGEDLCSRSLTDIKCVPCLERCNGIQGSCNTTQFFCPKQCGKTMTASKCPDVCDENCLDGQCEYTVGFHGLKCIGCHPPWTGQRCKELCSPNCDMCHQFTSTCIICLGDFSPPTCTPDLTPITSTATVKRFYRCSANCTSCNMTSGDCNECSYGNYGGKCESLCPHCNISVCEMDEKCLQCISNLSGSECIKAGARNNTWFNCTDSDCQKRPSAEQMELLTMICVLVAVPILLFGIIAAWRKLGRRYRLRCEDLTKLYRNRNQVSSGSLAEGNRYIYIDDNDLDPYYNGLNGNRTRPPPCPVKTIYESIGTNGAYQDIESCSSCSSMSETIFGNLFVVNAEYHDRDESSHAERQLCQDENKDYASVNEYEIHSYLTPSLSVASAISHT